ncbi:phage portal protein [Acetobacterium tundrae]|uniref:Phage portal protein n=2 Tax=Acetobacterium tundrae TaxID=132932 RepID=A0ABR6WPJ7_9FIRM|nr:phage portal protein [Acetobacterium tundrae]
MKLVEIAATLQIPEGTIRSWKKRYKWDATLQTEKRNVANKNSNERFKKKASIPEVESVIENLDLTDEQRLFCLYYSKSFNATRSYQKAYGCDYESAMANGCRMLRNDKVKDEIMNLKQKRYVRSFISEEDIFQKYWDIAFSDITDFLSFGRREVQVMGAFGPVKVKDDDGKEIQLTKEVNAVEFRESDEVDGSILTEVKQGKDGASIKLADRMKALQWLADHMDLATVEQKARIDKLKAETVIKDDREAKTEQSIQIYIPSNGRDAGK